MPTSLNVVAASPIKRSGAVQLKELSEGSGASKGGGQRDRGRVLELGMSEGRLEQKLGSLSAAAVSLFSKFYRGSRVDKGASVKIHRKLSTKMRIFVKRGLVTAGAGLVAAGISVVAAPVVVPAVVTSLGFTSAGIAGGSWAAGFMASYGGLVGAGSTCAILQSIGATGALAGSGVMAVAGAATTALGAAATALGVAVGKAGGEESADAEMAGENNCLTPAEALGKAGVEESVDAETAAENNCLTPAVDD